MMYACMSPGWGAQKSGAPRWEANAAKAERNNIYIYIYIVVLLPVRLDSKTAKNDMILMELYVYSIGFHAKDC